MGVWSSTHVAEKQNPDGVATYLVEHTLLHIGPIVDLEPE